MTNPSLKGGLDVGSASPVVETEEQKARRERVRRLHAQTFGDPNVAPAPAASVAVAVEESTPKPVAAMEAELVAPPPGTFSAEVQPSVLDAQVAEGPVIFAQNEDDRRLTDLEGRMSAAEAEITLLKGNGLPESAPGVISAKRATAPRGKRSPVASEPVAVPATTLPAPTEVSAPVSKTPDATVVVPVAVVNPTAEPKAPEAAVAVAVVVPTAVDTTPPESKRSPPVIPVVAPVVEPVTKPKADIPILKSKWVRVKESRRPIGILLAILLVAASLYFAAANGWIKTQPLVVATAEEEEGDSDGEDEEEGLVSIRDETDSRVAEIESLSKAFDQFISDEE